MKLQNRYLVAILFVVVCLLTRLAPHPANFTAIGALALWSNRFFPNRIGAFLLPLIALFLSDLVLGFHSTMVWVYGAFALVSVMSLWLDPAKSALQLLPATLLGSLLFFVVTNFGVWISGELYPMNLNGLKECYVMAIPFFKNQLLGDFTYSAVCYFVYKFQLQHKVAAAN